MHLEDSGQCGEGLEPCHMRNSCRKWDIVLRKKNLGGDSSLWLSEVMSCGRGMSCPERFLAVTDSVHTFFFFLDGHLLKLFQRESKYQMKSLMNDSEFPFNSEIL